MPLKKVEYLEEYKLMMIFSNGRKKIHDFKNFLFSNNHPSVIPYRKLSLFKKVKIDTDGTLTWGNNQMDFNPYNLPK